eukprot:jgi/Orpsp1_1/1182853/evm.model.c7180000082912.1
MVELMIQYAKDHNMVLNLNEKTMSGDYPILLALVNNNVEIIKLLINYANECGIIMIFKMEDVDENLTIKPEVRKLYNDYFAENEEDMKRFETSKGLLDNLFFGINSNSIEKVRSVFNDSRKYNLILNINQKNDNKEYPMLLAASLNNIEIVKSLIGYANSKDLILELNEVDKKKNYPILSSLINKNNGIFKLILDYAEFRNVDLELNKINKDKQYPFLSAVKSNNFEMVVSLLEYSINHSIILNYDINEINNLKINSDIIELCKIIFILNLTLKIYFYKIGNYLLDVNSSQELLSRKNSEIPDAKERDIVIVEEPSSVVQLVSTKKKNKFSFIHSSSQSNLKSNGDGSTISNEKKPQRRFFAHSSSQSNTQKINISSDNLLTPNSAIPNDKKTNKRLSFIHKRARSATVTEYSTQRS